MSARDAKNQLDNNHGILWSANTLSRGRGMACCRRRGDRCVSSQVWFVCIRSKGCCHSMRPNYWLTSAYGKEFPITDSYRQALDQAIDISNRIKNLKLPNCPPNSYPRIWGYTVVFPACCKGCLAASKRLTRNNPRL